MKQKNEVNKRQEQNINEDLSFLVNKYNINKNEFIIINKENDFYNPENVVNNNNLFDLSCSICLNILKNPINCSSNLNSHSFCKECIDIYLREYENCPICKNNFEYNYNKEIEKKLNELLFRCKYWKEGCDKIINYFEYFKHINECKYGNSDILYTCIVEKYNYVNKNFEPCNYIGKLKEVEEHFKKCAFFQYKCLFCKENIISLNFKEHSINKCKMRIFNDNDGDIYIGEIKNNQKDGFGIHYTREGDKYRGEWKRSKKHGFGMLLLSGGYKYEGEWKNDNLDGFAIITFFNGDRYEGECKNNKMNGYGKFNFCNGEIYEGEWKNNTMNGYGKLCQSNGQIIEGEWINNKIEGYGIIYFENSKSEVIFHGGKLTKIYS